MGLFYFILFFLLFFEVKVIWNSQQGFPFHAFKQIKLWIAKDAYLCPVYSLRRIKGMFKKNPWSLSYWLTLMSDVIKAFLHVWLYIILLPTADRLFLMLQRFPVESKGRRKKLQEVNDLSKLFVAL